MNVGQKNSRSINVLCLLLGYTRQSYYQGNKINELAVLQREIIIQKVEYFRIQQKKVGARKLLIHLQPFLQEQGISMGRDAFFALLSEHNLLIRKRRRTTPVTTFSNHWMRKYPNLIIGLIATEAHQLLVSDITYIRLSENHHSYLSLVTDAYSRKIVGYYLSANLCAEGCVEALKMAIKQLPKGAHPIHHSDRGSQYCSTDYTVLLNNNNISISMTQSGDPLENAIAERVNGILKTELLEEVFMSYKVAKKAIDQGISVYNNIRLHSSVDMLTPAEAHQRKGTLERRWKTYYKIKTDSKKEVEYVD